MELPLREAAGMAPVEAGSPGDQHLQSEEGNEAGEARVESRDLHFDRLVTRKPSFWVYQVEDQIPDPGAQPPPLPYEPSFHVHNDVGAVGQAPLCLLHE